MLQEVRDARCVVVEGALGLEVAVDLGNASSAQGYRLHWVIPAPRDQGERLWGEGPVLSSRKVLRELTAGETFMWLRAQMMFERVSPQFPEILAILPSGEHITFLCSAITRARCRQIQEAFQGGYHSSRVRFFVHQRPTGKEVLSALLQLLERESPRGWELQTTFY